MHADDSTLENLIERKREKKKKKQKLPRALPPRGTTLSILLSLSLILIITPPKPVRVYTLVQSMPGGATGCSLLLVQVLVIVGPSLSILSLNTTQIRHEFTRGTSERSEFQPKIEHVLFTRMCWYACMVASLA